MIPVRRRTAAMMAGIGLCAQGALLAQNWILNPFQQAASTGARLYSVSVFSSYYSGGSLFGGPLAYRQRTAPDTYGGVSASFGWSKSGERSGGAITYSPSYLRTVRDSSFQGTNHALNASWNTRVGPKWQFQASAGGTVSNLEQSLFTPTPLYHAAAGPGTFDELAGAVMGGRIGDSAAALALTGGSLLSSAEQAFPYGGRFTNIVLQTGLSYLLSQRTALTVAASGSRAQHLPDGRRVESQQDYLIPQTTVAAATAGWTHSLSPRTQVGSHVSYSRTYSRLQQANTTQVTASIGRTVSRRWFVQGRFGAGYLAYGRQIYAASTGMDYVAGGSLGVKGASQTLLMSCDRVIGDSYGIGASSTVTCSGAWNWRPLRRSFALEGMVGYRRLLESVLELRAGWSASAGFAKSLGSHVFLGIQAGYFQLPSYGRPGRSQRAQEGVMVSLTWSPAANR